MAILPTDLNFSVAPKVEGASVTEATEMMGPDTAFGTTFRDLLDSSDVNGAQTDVEGAGQINADGCESLRRILLMTDLSKPPRCPMQTRIR